MKITVKKIRVLYTFPLLLFASLSATDFSSSPTVWLLQKILMPFDVITTAGQYQWNSFNPLPEYKTAQQIKNEMQGADYDARFPYEYEGKSGAQSIASFVKTQLSNVIEKETGPTVQQLLLYKYGPLCLSGRVFVRGAHTVPWTFLATPLKYMIIASLAHELYCAVRALKNTPSLKIKKREHKRCH